MSTPQPVAFQGTLQLAADQSLPQAPIPFNASGTYTELAQLLLDIAGAGSTNVPFGTIGSPGAKGVFIRYDAQPAPAAAVTVAINAGSQPVELTPGGFLALFSPNPSAGITSLSITATAACQLRVWLLG